MSIVYALKLMCDLYYYMAIIGMIGMLAQANSIIILLPVLLGIGAGIGYAWKEKGEGARYLPLALGLTIFILARGGQDYVVGVPAFAYAVFYVKSNKRATDYYYASERFRQGLIFMAIAFLWSLTSLESQIEYYVPPLFLHLALSITLMRMLRHDDRIIRQKRFQMLNLAGIVGVCAVGVVLSTKWVLALLKAFLGLLYQYLLSPVLTVLVWILTLIMQAATLLMSLFFKDSGEIEMPSMQSGTQVAEEEGTAFIETAEAVASNPMVRRVLEIIGVIILIVAAFWVIKLLSKQVSRDTQRDQKETRETLESPDSANRGLGGMLRRRNDAALGVRHIYWKFLRLAQGKNVPLNGRQNSLQIRDLSVDSFDEQGLDELREVYIRARYDGDSSPDDLEKAKKAYSRLKTG